MQCFSRSKTTLVWSPIFLGLLLGLIPEARAVSFQNFAPVFSQITNGIASIQASFDNSPATKSQLAALVAAEQVLLDPVMADRAALASLVNLIGGNADYTVTLDESADNVRATVLAQHDQLASRLAEAPPSARKTTAQRRFADLTTKANALANAVHAAAISDLIPPYLKEFTPVEKLVTRAEAMPVPVISQNSVRASVGGRAFVAAGTGLHSPNSFEVAAPGPLYLSLNCRAVDGTRVINFALPVVTAQVRYEVAQGLVALTYTEDVFSTNVTITTATNGTFFVQRDRREIYGVFSAQGPGFQLQDGKFRIRLPVGLRGR